MNKFFGLSSACLLNESKTKTQVWLIYKQTNINKFFIEPSLSSLSSAWFIYTPNRELLTQHILVGPITKCVCGPLVISIYTSQIGPFSPLVLTSRIMLWNPWNPTTQSTRNYLYDLQATIRPHHCPFWFKT